MEPTMNHAEELKSSGLKATLPRIKILEVFQQAAQRHMTAEEVYKVLLNEGSDIGLATVYRVLMQFEQAGLLSRNHFEAGKAVFELNEGQHHDHLVCVHCGRVEEFYDAEIERRQQQIAEARGYKLQDHALSLYVVCNRPECQAKGGTGGHAHHHG
jgi:Fur family ferric uptake transcriptional regulator